MRSSRRLEGRKSVLICSCFLRRPSRRPAPPEAGQANAATREAEPTGVFLCGSRRSFASILCGMKWLVKEEPTHYNFDQFVADGKTVWSGVKNPLAQKHLRA